MKKGDRVLVVWYDITAELHTEDDIEPVEAETVGWIDCCNKNWVRIVTTRYREKRRFAKLSDKIVIPKGCIKSIEGI